MGEIKQANFRIDTDTAAQFRDFCEMNGMNQAQGFDHIMQIVELDKAKTTIPARATEIEEFERHTKALITAYLNGLEVAESTEERVLEQFRSKIESKDQTIIELQQRVKAKEELAVAANTAAMEAENRAAAADQIAKAATEKEKTALAAAKDKEEINSMLAGKLKDAEAKLTEYPELKKENEKLQSELAKALQTIKDNQKDAELAQERAVSAVQIEKERAVAAMEKTCSEKVSAAEKEHAEKMAKAEREHSEKTAAMEKDYKGELKELRQKLDTLNDERIELRDKIAELKSELLAIKNAKNVIK